MNWYEVVALFKDEDDDVRVIEGSNVHIRGEVDDVLVIQIPAGVNHGAILSGVQEILRKEKLEKSVIVLDKNINVVKFKPVEKNKANVMETKYQEAIKQERVLMKQNAPTTQVQQ